VKDPSFAVFATIVATSPKFVETPCFKSRVTVPELVGSQVITTGVPAVKPALRVVEFRVKGLAPADTMVVRVDMKIVKRVVICIFVCSSFVI